VKGDEQVDEYGEKVIVARRIRVMEVGLSAVEVRVPPDTLRPYRNYI
jgi:hypothetical protein